MALYYTIPSDNRELQQTVFLFHDFSIIPYQVITGNYNRNTYSLMCRTIIPYQVITGNYNGKQTKFWIVYIIPYQVITGNYNVPDVEGFCSFIIPYQVITGNYNVGTTKCKLQRLYHTK